MRSSRNCPAVVLIAIAAGGVLSTAAAAEAQLRVATWNVSAYDGSNREQAFKTSIYGTFSVPPHQGGGQRQMAPDVLLVQELRGPGGLIAFRNLLNSAANSPGDWAVSSFIPSPDNNAQAIFYRTSKVELLSTTVISPGGTNPHHPRPVQRFDIRPVGYTAPATMLACYSTHMKAGSSATDQSRRLVEAQVIRADAESLPEAWNFLLAGDLNIQSSSQQAYMWLVGAQLNETGRFYDPIRAPGAWNNNADFRFVHTQAPAGNPSTSGGMDDRYDQILLSAGLVGAPLPGSPGQQYWGFSYIGDFTIPYSTTTWDDPNHSYRAWGNDGASYKQNITISGNQMVGTVIAQALFDSAHTDASGGHLPVFLDLRVPPQISSVLLIDFGDVEVGTTGGLAEKTLTVSNSGNIQLWTAAGISGLNYTLKATTGFSAPAGSFSAAAGAPGGQHIITIDTSTIGPRQGTVTIFSDAPDQPERIVIVQGTVVEPSPCYANCDGSTIEPILNVDDFTCFINEFAAAQALPHEEQLSHYANCDGSTIAPVLNVDDFICFINAFAAGCP